MDYQEARQQLLDDGWFPTGAEPSVLGQLDVLGQHAAAGDLSDRQAAAMYALVQRLRYLADKYERDLIRSLRWNPAGDAVRTWAEVAEAVQAQLGSRQAAHRKWSRLKSPARRTTSGNARHGAAIPRRGDD